MSHQRYPSLDPVKEPHSISLKVLRLSRPSLVVQHPLRPPTTSDSARPPPLVPASLAYTSCDDDPNSFAGDQQDDANPAPFLLSPILNLPLSFGSAYVGETFSCTLCANHDTPDVPAPPAPAVAALHPGSSSSSNNTLTPSSTTPGVPPTQRKRIRDVRIEAEMKTPGAGAVQKLELAPADAPDRADLEPGQTLQRIVSFDLKEEGNHVLAVTVSYYEAGETSGRTRTFRKLYQFICKAGLIVRTKTGPLDVRRPIPNSDTGDEKSSKKRTVRGKAVTCVTRRKRWVLEAQLENCSEDVMQLERVFLETEPGLACRDCNWGFPSGGDAHARPVLHPGEVEQVCFVVDEAVAGSASSSLPVNEAGRMALGVLGIGWRGEMGNRGFLSTGKLGTRYQ